MKYVTLFWTKLDPLPLSHFVTHLGTPLKYVTHLETPQFLVVHAFIHMSLQGVCLSLWCFLSRRFVRGGFCLSPLLSEYICYNIKLNITFNVRFYMYEKRGVTSSWTFLLPLITNCHPFSDPSPSSVTYFMNGS